MHQHRYWLVMAALFAFGIEVLAQSGGGSDRGYEPRTITVRPQWSEDFKGALARAAAAEAPILVVFSTSTTTTAGITAEVRQRDSRKPEVRTLQKMQFVRLILKAKDLERTGDKAPAAAVLARRYGVKRLPAAVAADRHGNLLFAVSPKGLRGRGLLGLAKKARLEQDRLAREIDRNYRAGLRQLKAGRPDTARTSLEKAARYQGYEGARKARAALEKLPRE